MTSEKQILTGNKDKHIVSVKNPHNDKTEVFGFTTLQNARLFMQEIAKMKLTYNFTHKEGAERE